MERQLELEMELSKFFVGINKKWFNVPLAAMTII